MSLPPLSLKTILSSDKRLGGELRVQVLVAEAKQTKDKKPYVALSLSDGGTPVSLSVWSDHPSFATAQAMVKGDCHAFSGNFSMGKFGLESSDWKAERLDGDARRAVFAGSPELRAKQDTDWAALLECLQGCEDGTLKTLGGMLLTDYEEPYRRAAAARGNHHARRGGLVEHVSLMAQSAVALCGVYRDLRRDLLVCGVIFHDAGKMIENQFQAEGFDMPFSFRAEAYIPLTVRAAGVLSDRNIFLALPAAAL